jgi:hypothetical protein
MNPSLIVTSIAPPGPILEELARQSVQHKFRFVVIGDAASPPDFALDGCEFYSLQAQETLPFAVAGCIPHRNYARKNIGYLLAMAGGSDLIIETDDDNLPQPGFWSRREEVHVGECLNESGWVNVYKYFSKANIWPRGYPLELVGSPIVPSPVQATVCCPIQQGLADGNPDVDAVYRLILPLPLCFHRRRIALGANSWCPFNSQNTTFFKAAFELMYLPSLCSMRMTDIWRGFIAQRIAWTNGWSVLYHEATVFQERNEHNLMKDFELELPGYLNNFKIVESLTRLPLRRGSEHIAENLRLCYRELVRLAVIPEGELTILDAWLQDVRAACNPSGKRRPIKVPADPRHKKESEESNAHLIPSR